MLFSITFCVRKAYAAPRSQVILTLFIWKAYAMSRVVWITFATTFIILRIRAASVRNMPQHSSSESIYRDSHCQYDICIHCWNIGIDRDKDSELIDCYKVEGKTFLLYTTRLRNLPRGKDGRLSPEPVLGD